MPLEGSNSQHQIGARKTFVAGLLLFTAASAGCGLAPNAAVLIAARVVQGIGAASLVPCSLSLINHAFHHDPGKRARAISLWTAAGGVGLSAGPVLGGTLTDAFGWRSVFLINLPVGLAVPAMTASLLETVPKARSGVTSGVLNTVRQSAGAVGVALYGAFLATAGVPGMRTAFALSSVLLLLAAVVAALGIRERNACPNLSDECRVPGVE